MDTQKAHAYVTQAIGRQDELEAAVSRLRTGAADWPAVKAVLVSLRANLVSAQAELEPAEGQP